MLDANGDSARPAYRLNIDPRWTKAMFAMADAVKRPCHVDPWRDCAIDRTVKALSYGAAMAPHCPGFGDFAGQFNCLVVGATAAEIVESLKTRDRAVQFVRDHGDDQAAAAGSAARMLIDEVQESCRSSPAGCIRAQGETRLEATLNGREDCAPFADEMKAAACLFIGRMSDLLSGAASRLRSQ